MDDNSEDFPQGYETTKQNVLEEYYTLLQKQDKERRLLLNQITSLIESYKSSESGNSKNEEILEILKEMKRQFESGGKENQKETISIKTSTITPDLEIVENLPEEIQVLHDLLESKKEEVLEKDRQIVEYNSEIEAIAIEKNSLIVELERLNQVIESWKNQLEMLESMAEGDPRFRMIEALKSHERLTEIQLAFALGTSISQVRKFINDLRDMELIKIEKDGRIRWVIS